MNPGGSASSRRRLWRLAGASLALLSGACLAASVATDGDTGRSDEAGPAPAPRCAARFREARVVATRPALLPESIWDRKPTWNATVRFRIDETGAPAAIKATVLSDVDDRYALERVTADALARYRFCLPEQAAADSRWVAHMRFAYTRLGARNGDGEAYLQQLTPSYTRAEVLGGRAGTVRVRGTFAPDGQATAVEVVDSSGDTVLDAKSLESMAEQVLVLRDAGGVTRPIVFEQPFKFRPY